MILTEGRQLSAETPYTRALVVATRRGDSGPCCPGVETPRLQSIVAYANGGLGPRLLFEATVDIAGKSVEVHGIKSSIGVDKRPGLFHHNERGRNDK